MRRHLQLAGGAVLFTLLLAAPLRMQALKHSHGGSDDDNQITIFSTIEVSEDHPADDIVCAFCSVRVRGDVHGDIAVMFATVDVDEGRTISGDVAALFSTLRLGENSRIGGDLASALGRTDLAPGASIGGERAVMGSGLGIAIVVAPLLIVAGVIWLLVWVVRRVLT